MERELFKKIHAEILDYTDDQFLLKSANWGYEAHQTLLKHNLYLGCLEPEEEGGEQSSPFIYAVATAVIVGEFGKFLNNGYFSEETELSLSKLGLNFNKIIGFINEDIDKDRLEILKESNTVSLQDLWEAIGEWKKEIYKSLFSIHKQQGEKEPAVVIFKSLLELMGEDDINKTSEQRLSAYAYISNGFRF